MKMTSGRRKQERQGRALDRLLVQTWAAAHFADPENPRSPKQWEERRQTEIETLRKRTGRIA